MQLARQDVALPAARARLQPLPSLRSVQGLQLALFTLESPPSAFHLGYKDHENKSNLNESSLTLSKGFTMVL